MDRFQAMQVFTRVVEANSFTLAADSLGLPRSTVTTTIQNLERNLQVRLLNRTTRRLSLTPDGASYYERCVRILADVEEAEASFRDVTRGPQGRLRIDVPSSMGRLILVPALCEFHNKYPDIELALGMGDRPVNLVQEAVDCVIRVGELEDSSLVAKRIGTFEMVNCAAPAYIERWGEPSSIADLANHRAVHYFSSRTGRIIDWSFLVNGKEVSVPLKGSISVNESEAYVTCGLKGFGLIQPSRYMVARYLASGELKEVLADQQTPSLPISVVYQHNRHLSPKVRVFVDWVAELFQRCPLLSGQRCSDFDSECNFAGQGKHDMHDTLSKVLRREPMEEGVY
ncbi:LysR family transcriptional regulator [Allopusillimonas soli]|uniref:LysR family transcriptional regulator n=1 Tax=Allopusillimonas soli TaxID=659016 RepID=A0A853FA59_9BURK|nr:LysR family transcriptional regulator [Allopusillimonas soli]NYT36819.1 LysR family transcriptional regulator [Allopusillimonas soli]TEA75282.1 LysR family transcriptional regulator [Allopusillimonas soli]